MRTPARGVALLALATLLAGCVGDATPAGALDSAATPEDTERELGVLDLYAFEDLVIGASPADDTGTLPYRETLEPSLVETFEVPPNVTSINLHADIGPGLGRGQVDVYDSLGERIYTSRATDCVGTPMVAVCLIPHDDQRRDGYPAGTYRVEYWATGALQFRVEASARAPVDAPESGTVTPVAASANHP